MNHYVTKAVLTIALAFGLGCASAQKAEVKEMNKEIQSQTPADTPEQIAERAAQTFSNAEGLTQEQKTKLNLVYKNVYLESMRIRREIGQSKSLLFATLAKPDYKESEITNLKKKIVGLDQKRLTTMFSALDDVQKIVGKGKALERIYKHFEEYEIPHRIMNDYQY